MAERSSDFRDTLVELIEASPEPMDHPSSDQWIAYHRGELAEGEEARLQEHLVRCRDCFDLAEAAAAFAESDAGQEVESTALWRLLRPQLGPSTDNVRAISAGPRRRPSWTFRLPSSVAALFLVALVGLSAWNLQLRSSNEALRAPQPNPVIFNMASVERAPGQREQTIPAGLRMLVVFRPHEELPAYRLAIRDAATGRELSFSELRRDENLALTLYLPEGLPPGRYRLELADRAGKILETRLLSVTETVKRPGR
jgi:hypothetical protein